MDNRLKLRKRKGLTSTKFENVSASHLLHSWGGKEKGKVEGVGEVKKSERQMSEGGRNERKRILRYERKRD